MEQGSEFLKIRGKKAYERLLFYSPEVGRTAPGPIIRYPYRKRHPWTNYPSSMSLGENNRLLLPTSQKEPRPPHKLNQKGAFALLNSVAVLRVRRCREPGLTL